MRTMRGVALAALFVLVACGDGDGSGGATNNGQNNGANNGQNNGQNNGANNGQNNGQNNGANNGQNNAGNNGDDDLTETYALAGEVETIVDDRGIPHFYGGTDQDVFYAAGYKMATDRLYHMAMTRRRAYGRMSEVLGDQGVADDELARIFDWSGFGIRDSRVAKQVNPETWGIIVAWVSGVNRRVAEIHAGQAPLPYGFGPDEYDFLPEMWSNQDALVIGKMIGFGNDLSLEFEIFATIADRFLHNGWQHVEPFRPVRDVWTVPDEDIARVTEGRLDTGGQTPWLDVPTYTPAAYGDLSGSLRKLQKDFAPLRVVGSNNFAVDGRHTASGRPLIAADPHQGFDLPGIFYALHLNSKDQGGSFNVTGMSFTGVPGVSIGHTEKVIWTMTTSFADVMDVFEVQRLDDGAAVKLGEERAGVATREEIILVRQPGDPVGEGRPISYTMRDVPGHGVMLPPNLVPIPVAKPGYELMLAWTGFLPSTPGGIIELNRAQSIEDFDRAIEGQGSLNFNFIAADAQGITYKVGVRVPDRDLSTGIKPWYILDGDDPASFWSDNFLSPSQKPASRAGERGWLATANNDPFGFTADGDPSNDPWYYGAYFSPGWRAARVSALVGEVVERGDVELDDMKAIQLDLHSNLADDLLPALEAAHTALPEDESLVDFREREDLEVLVQILLGWDREMATDSQGALLFHAFAHFLTKRTFADDFSIVYNEAMSLQPVFILKFLSLALRGRYPTGDALFQQGVNVALYQSLSDTSAWLETRFGSAEPDGRQLGDMSRTTLHSTMGAGIDFGMLTTPGGESTVNVRPSKFFKTGEPDEAWVSNFGPLLRLLGEFHEDGTPQIRLNWPKGQVAEPDSPHHDDHTADWMNGEYKTFLYARDEVEAHAESRYTLSP